MGELQITMLDRMFQRIMRGLVETGRPPHYAELARALGPSVEGQTVRVDAPCLDCGDPETRRHMLDGDYLSVWFPKRAAERREYMMRIGKSIPFWLGTPDA